MAKGVDVIYTPQLLDSTTNLLGTPDFLIKHEDGEYQPVDVKLVKTSEYKKEIEIQFGIYQRLLKSNLSGIIYLGNGEPEKIYNKSDKLVDDFIKKMNKILTESDPPTARYVHSECKECPYYSVCYPQFIDKGEITLLYDINKNLASELEKIGINSYQKLSELDPASIPEIPYLKTHEKKEKAVQRAKSWRTGEVIKLNNIKLPEGTWVHFDVENNPLEISDSEHVYLWGLLGPDYDKDAFQYSWTDSMEDDQKGWEKFLTFN